MVIGLDNLDLSPEQLAVIGQLLNGKPKPATRKEVKAWASRILGEALEGPKGPTRLMPMVCPKCSKPISVSVPTAPKSEPALPTLHKGRDNLAHALNVAAKTPSIDKAADDTRKAIDQLISTLGNLKEAL